MVRAGRRAETAPNQPLGTTKEGELHSAPKSRPKVALATVTPDVENDMHNGTVGQAV